VAAQDEVIEAARLALVQGRNPFAGGRGDELRTLLLRGYSDPVAGLIGAHLLLRAIQAEPDPGAAQADRQLFGATVVRLRGLGGPANPDIEALSLHCPDPALWTRTPFTVPPMFAASWSLMVDASFDRPELLPDELWEAGARLRHRRAFFAYAVDDAPGRRTPGCWPAGRSSSARGRRTRPATPPAA